MYVCALISPPPFLSLSVYVYIYVHIIDLPHINNTGTFTFCFISWIEEVVRLDEGYCNGGTPTRVLLRWSCPESEEVMREQKERSCGTLGTDCSRDLSLISIVVRKHHDQKQREEERVDLFTLLHHSPQPKESGQELRQRTWGILLPGLLNYSLFNWLSYATQDHLPRIGTTHSKQGIPTSITNQENSPQI